MLKRFLLSLIIFLISYMCAGQSLSHLYGDFTNARNVESVNMNPFVMALLRPFMTSAEMNGVKIKSLQVMDLSDCDPEVKQCFSERVMEIDDSMYERLVQVNDSKESVRIFAKMDGDAIRELVVLTTGDDAAFVRIRGRFRMSDLNKLVTVR